VEGIVSADEGNVLKREAKRILRKLMGGAALWRLAGGGYAVALRARRLEDVRLRFPAVAVEALAARGFFERRADGALILSDAGRGFYLRLAAEGDVYAAQHRAIETRKVAGEDGREVHVAVNLAESPLTLLHRRGLMGDGEFAAGERLRRDFTLAQLGPRLGMDWSAPCCSGRRAVKPDHISDAVLAAKQRFSAAMRAAGPGLAGILFDVCCNLSGLEENEKRRKWPRASARIVLNIALSRLARHYGIEADAVHGRTRAWISEEEFRP
jgi:hypothetical protein